MVSRQLARNKFVSNTTFSGTRNNSETTIMYNIDYGDAVITISASLVACILAVVVCYFLYQAFHFFQTLIWDFFTVSVQFSAAHETKSDASYFGKVDHFIGKLTTLSQEKPRGRLFGFWRHLIPLIRIKQGRNGLYQTKVKGGANYGTSFFIYKGHWVRIIRLSSPTILSKNSTCDLMKISTFRWHGEILKSLIVDAVQPKYAPPEKRASTTTVYGIASDRWLPLGYPKPIRTLASVFLTQGQAEDLIQDVQEFFDSKDWFEERCIPHHRGYLLHGPAGCGKTSLIRAVAGQFKHDICALSLSTHGLTDDSLLRYLNSTPHQTIILIEDVDCTFKSRGDETATTAETNLVLAGTSGSGVTFRGLLNALDGVATCDGKIVFLTTNHPEKLDPALTRPGRVDMRILLDYPDKDQLERFFCRFYPEASGELKNSFLEEIQGIDKVTMAMVQGLFMNHKKNAAMAVSSCKTYFQDQFNMVSRRGYPTPISRVSSTSTHQMPPQGMMKSQTTY